MAEPRKSATVQSSMTDDCRSIARDAEQTRGTFSTQMPKGQRHLEGSFSAVWLKHKGGEIYRTFSRNVPSGHNME